MPILFFWGTALRYFLGFSLFILSLGSSYLFSLNSSYPDLFKHICESVEDSYFQVDRDFNAWIKNCYLQSEENDEVFFNKKALLDSLVKDVNFYFGGLGVSHLYLSPPVESNEILFHRVTDTGIRVRLVDGHFIVSEIIESSPAATSKLKEGDEILGKDGYELQFTSDVRSPGLFTVRSGKEQFDLQVDGAQFQIDNRPKLHTFTDRPEVAVLKIPSFEGRYQGKGLFESDYWKSIARQLQNRSKVIVDLRQNYGGNFAAMLRAASSFYCKPQSLGSIIQPRRIDLRPEGYFPDTLDGYSQLDALDQYQEIQLVSFDGYPCYRGPLIILVDSATASVSEIFAEGLKERAQTKIMGQPTSGSVLVARREELFRLGPGYVLNIPIASYFSPKGVDLESEGVRPEKIIYYDLELERQAKDSFIEAALKEFKSF